MGQTAKHIIVKVALSVLKEDNQNVACSWPLSAGQLSESDATVYSVQILLDSPDTEASLLVNII